MTVVHTVAMENDFEKYRIWNIIHVANKATSLRIDPTYSKCVILLNCVFMLIIPLTLMVLFQYRTYQEIKQINSVHNAISSHRRRDNFVARLFTSIIGIFIICHSVKFHMSV